MRVSRPERRACAREPAAPVVRVGERARLVGLRDRELRERAHALALGRRRLERPRERGQRPPRGRARHVLFVEDGRDLLPERARLARRAVVGRRLAHEVEAARRARARGVEEVAVAADLVGTLEPAAELAARVVVEERRRARAARQRPLLEPEQEDDLEAPRARAHQVEHRDPAGLERRPEPHLDALERAEHLLRRERLAEPRQRLELVEQPQRSRRTCAGRAATSRLPAAPRCRTRSAASSGSGRARRRAATRPRAARRARERAPRAASRSPPRRAPGVWIARPRRRPST